ncbi:MAG: hypothetical protein ACPGWR_23640 [Ardenticatenaceae bacterium]
MRIGRTRRDACSTSQMNKQGCVFYQVMNNTQYAIHNTQYAIRNIF